ncbi:MAG: NADH:ubiquinone reductase (Na(+)-transporting) subunit B [Planctomycetota bacterium]|jgi:Na+-transporting NADH:ubiquinone oxidoreductase subunit B|nr:NADH:ubiquinone reductase (Na(+)-transporting) subunit B [Planctomycetota bacterium]
MKFLRKKLDAVAPLFEKGGKLEKWYPLYEAGDSFLYTPGHRTHSGPHVRDVLDLKRMMTMVVIALMPCILWSIFNNGYQAMLADSSYGLAVNDAITFSVIKSASWIGLLAFLPLYIVTVAAGGLVEAIFSIVRKHEINEGFLVTSMLFPLIVPADIPLWQVAIGIIFGTLIGKEVFGGTGMNILNPALTGRLFLFIAYPAQISGEVWTKLPDDPALAVDGHTGATALAAFYTDGATATANMNWMDAFLGLMPGSFAETSTLACLIGAVILIASGIGSWRIMLSCLLGMIGTSYLLNALAPSPEHYMAIDWTWHLVVGGFAFGMVFMATDPVSASQTDTGKWIYGALIGMLTVIVRVLNPAYPEGMMLAIIFMNVFAPTIDYYVVKANVKRREKRLGLQ